jgi:hypothetical protein
MNGAFPQLQELDLGQNTEIKGTLPAAWGSDNSSMTLLRRFKISTANLTGSLPAQWAQTLPAMSSLNISNNLISGREINCLWICCPQQIVGSAQVQNRIILIFLVRTWFTDLQELHLPCGYFK